MALTYSLKYKKLNFSQRVVLEKEGEIIIDRQSFRLKGKGANDHGENIYFGDIKDMIIKDDYLCFTTLTREKYVLGDFANLFDSFLKDFLRVRNEYLAESLFMKIGMLLHEYDGHVEIVNNFGKIINKGKSRIQFYEGSIVVIPETRECFVVYLDFLKNHEFDEDEYVLRLYLDNGSNIHISKFGTSFDDVRETMESQLGKMYEKVVNPLIEIMPDFDPATLLKLAYKIKNGRLMHYPVLKKIHEDMPVKILQMLVSGKNSEKLLFLKKMAGDENFYLSFVTHKNDQRDISVKPWFLFALPDKNLLLLGVLDSKGELVLHSFRIIMLQGDAKEKLAAKLMEVEQTMVLFKMDLTAVYKDRKDLKKTRYRTAIKKLSFLRLLRKSYLGSTTENDLDKLKDVLMKIESKALCFEQVNKFHKESVLAANSAA